MNTSQHTLYCRAAVFNLGTVLSVASNFEGRRQIGSGVKFWLREKKGLQVFKSLGLYGIAIGQKQ